MLKYTSRTAKNIDNIRFRKLKVPPNVAVSTPTSVCNNGILTSIAVSKANNNENLPKNKKKIDRLDPRGI